MRTILLATIALGAMASAVSAGPAATPAPVTLSEAQMDAVTAGKKGSFDITTVGTSATGKHIKEPVLTASSSAGGGGGGAGKVSMN